jgi:hypothetical protein
MLYPRGHVKRSHVHQRHIIIGCTYNPTPGKNLLERNSPPLPAIVANTPPIELSITFQLSELGDLLHEAITSRPMARCHKHIVIIEFSGNREGLCPEGGGQRKNNFLKIECPFIFEKSEI